MAQLKRERKRTEAETDVGIEVEIFMILLAHIESENIFIIHGIEL